MARPTFRSIEQLVLLPVRLLLQLLFGLKHWQVLLLLLLGWGDDHSGALVATSPVGEGSRGCDGDDETGRGGHKHSKDHVGSCSTFAVVTIKMASSSYGACVAGGGRTLFLAPIKPSRGRIVVCCIKYWYVIVQYNSVFQLT